MVAAYKREEAGYRIFCDREKLKDFYGFMARNSSLTFYQCTEVLTINPNATVVKTFDDWHGTTDRRITRGSKAIAVTDEKYPNRKKYLFDVSQTYGFKAYRTGENITDAQLLDAINSQFIWKQAVNGVYRNRLYTAVSDYCEAHYILPPDKEASGNAANYQKAITDGVFTCIISRYNKPQEYIKHENFTVLDEKSMIWAAHAAADITKSLFEKITEYRSKRYEQTQQRQNQPGRKVDIIPASEVGQTLFDLADQVRNTETQLHGGTRAEPVFRVIAGGQAERLPSESAERRGEITGASDGGVAQDYEAASGSGNVVFGEGTVREQNSADDTRDNFGGNSLRNYRLTDENFKNLGGQKTRFQNNVAAIRLIQELEASGMPATEEQQAVLARYVGWGGIPQAFDEKLADWAKEYKELKELLSAEDYKLAMLSTMNAHYTSKTVIDAIYQALSQMGFNKGNVLEPAVGTGNFIGLMPENYQCNAHGVELDNITGKIAKHLYPNADIQIKGFENTNFPDNYFDCVATNVPFGSYNVHDPKYNKYDLFIHNYFILKSLDKLREGGVAAIVTTKGTLDKASPAARLLFADKAELLGAVRLPNNAFKATAGTEATTDILFFQKAAPENAAKQNMDWINVSDDANGVPLNNYYIKHPYMVLGTMKKGMSMYGNENETYCEPDGRDLTASLTDAIKNLPENIYTTSQTLQQRYERRIESGEPVPAIPSVKNYCYAVIKDKIYMRVDDEMAPQNISSTQELRLKSMIGLRQQVRNLLNVQNEGCPDGILLREQGKLNAMYDSFVKKFGCLNTKTNRNLFREDADYTLLISIENYDEASGAARKMDIFSKRTIRKYTRPTHADTVLEALQISKNETGKVDLKIIEELTGKSYDDIISELDGYIYRNPEVLLAGSGKYDSWETASEYLSGNVRRKLEFAKIYAKDDTAFKKNVNELERVQPVPLTASEISVRLGMGWIDPEIYKQFIIEKFKLRRYNWIRNYIKLDFNSYTQSWKLEAPSLASKSFESTDVYGTKRMNGCKVFEHAINLQTPSIFDKETDANGNEKRVLNKPETIAVREKLRKIQEEFKAWAFDEPKRREELVRVYNEKYNNLVLASYDGSYLKFPEMNPEIELKDYQKDAVERIITSGNTLLHHVVGAGKSFEIAAAAMKLRQLKLAQKPMIIVPNHLVLQWANEFRKLYPQANLLIATKKDFEKENRLKFVSRIATGDWDAVIMAMSSFEKIPISKERQARKIQEEIDSIQERLDELRKDDEDNRISIKTMVKVLKNKETYLKELSESKKDDLIKFEDLGVDYLFVDEAQKYKNKFIFTKMSNVAGISQAASKRSSDLDMKIDYITELHGGQKGVVFATGTPISNSMTEMFTMQSYLQRQDLAEAGLHVFDHWAANFGETVSALELAPSGQGYRSKTRFAKFCNLPELLKMYRKFADVKTADMLNLPVPKANKHVINIKPTVTILELCDIITERAEKINNKQVKPEIDNFLKITGDGRKIALDPRCFDSMAQDNPEHKVNICAENVYGIWEKTADKCGTQLIFCDISTPKMAFEKYNPDMNFDIYNHVKTALVQMGIPAGEIAFIHEAENDVAKQTLFDNVRAGKVRILMGSTEKCGAGTNVQNRLVALHHLDTPYRPADLEQREGRAIRQGNGNAEVDIYTYVTERTFDSYSYQILENKARFISQINKGELTVREAADIDELTLTYAEIKAITSANPLIKRKHEVENDLSNLQVLEMQYRNNRYALQDKLLKFIPHSVSKTNSWIEELEKDIVLRDGNKSDEFVITIAGKQYTERKDAAELLYKYITSQANVDKTVAVYKGFEIIPEPLVLLDNRTVLVRGNGKHQVTVSESATGMLIRIDNVFKGFEAEIESLKEKLQTYNADTEAARVELEKPFEHAQKITDLTLELEKINAELNLDKKEIDVVIDDTKFQNEVKAADTDDEIDDGDENDGDGDGQEYVVPENEIQRGSENYL